MEPHAQGEPAPGGHAFLTTRWSIVRTARGADVVRARAALEELCRAYWFPLYAFVRHAGFGSHEAEDIVQGFFTRLIDKRDLDAVSEDKGRFRSFLLAALQHFVSNWRDHERAAKRGGGLQRLAIDLAAADDRLGLCARDADGPERVFERAWARELMQHCIDDLEAEYRSTGRGALFAALEPALQASTELADRAELAAQLGLTEGALKVAVHRLRARFRERLRQHIAGTVATADEVEDELRDLFRALRP